MAEKRIRPPPLISGPGYIPFRAESVQTLAAVALLVLTAVPGTGPGGTALSMSLTVIRTAFAALPAAAASLFAQIGRVGDIQLGAYGGPATTSPSDVHLSQPNGTHLTIHDVRWRGEPFKRPPYYGYRGTLWPADGAFGAMLDFTHIKAEAFEDQTVHLSGQLDGEPRSGKESLSRIFQKLEFTHGYNLLTLNALYRRVAKPNARLVPYFGVGIGLSIPHVELYRTGWANETRTNEYQIGGPAMQLLAGVEWRFAHRISLFVEYKLTCSLVSGNLVGGGSVKTDLCSHQLLSGPTLHLRSRAG